MAVTHAPSIRNAMAQAVVSSVDVGTVTASGRLLIFDSLGNLLSTVALQNPSFQAPIAGVALAYPVTADPSPVTGAVPARYEVHDCNGALVFGGSCGPLGDLGCPNVQIAPGQPVNVTDFAYVACP